MVIEEFPAFGSEDEMEGVTFDLDTVVLEEVYGVSRAAAYAEMEKRLAALGYKHVQYSVYICPEPSKSGKLLTVELYKTLADIPWFSECVRQVTAFKVAEWGDLTPAFKN